MTLSPTRSLLLALLAAAVLLITIVLPAEHGIDPTGIGQALGLTALAPQPKMAVTRNGGSLYEHRQEMTLAPFESFEIKFLLVAEASLLFDWEADGEVVFDLHAQADGAPPSDAVSFDAGTAAAAAGSYIAPFAGEHGWFFENRGASPVKLTVDIAGFAANGRLYRDGNIQPFETQRR